MAENDNGAEPINTAEVHPLDTNRTRGGKFAPGNRAAAVRGIGRSRQAYRRVLSKAITEKNVETLIGILWRLATKTKTMKVGGKSVKVWDGEEWALKELLNRTLGPVKSEEDAVPDGDGAQDIQIVVVDNRTQNVIVQGGGNGNGHKEAPKFIDQQ